MDYLEGFVTMVGHVAWPGAALSMAVIARKELRDVFQAVARRIEDKNSEVSITKEGLAIKAVVAAQEARIVSMQAEQDQVKSLALRQFQSPASTKVSAVMPIAEHQGIDARLQAMADAYMAINIPDYSERTRAKNTAAQEMAFYVVSNHIDKGLLAKEKHEGLLIALAESIILSADVGDADRLLAAAHGAKRLHVRYRVLIALTKLLERNLLPLPSLGNVRALLLEYDEGADVSLKRQLSNVTSLVDEAVRQPTPSPS